MSYQQPGYPPQQMGYPPQGQPQYPPQGQPGYPPQGQPQYPPQGQPGYPPQQPGYPPQGAPLAYGAPPGQYGAPPQPQYAPPPQQLGPVQCPNCMGKGGFDTWSKPCERSHMHFKAVCPTCNGNRTVQGPHTPCRECNGEGNFDVFNKPCKTTSMHCKRQCTSCQGRAFIGAAPQGYAQQQQQQPQYAPPPVVQHAPGGGGGFMAGFGAALGGLAAGMAVAAASAGGGASHALLRHGARIRLENVHTRKNLRIKNNREVDALGGNGPPATWTVHTHGAHFKLKNGVGHYLAIKGDQVCDGQGGRFCELSIQPHQGHFVIRSADNRSGVAFPDGGNYAKAATHVGHGAPAQFKLERA